MFKIGQSYIYRGILIQYKKGKYVSFVKTVEGEKKVEGLTVMEVISEIDTID